ncbi:Para-nitrobenzyl esterase [Sinomonas atrocyanea]|uniref:Carboxylic ester hydrolase n=1 Tax=Sinomonas atrocyanea TaxID=37927 RepID=A0A126ZUY8_9MICC|nr:carboxylesterase/lipase family protein [Sinomonas atrocyanea]AMM30777.1 Para-nitrobenzyl esterase [Sinomonas atrocyanea]GEB63823.1 carboxylic ester hydrolase [Sinomonas atrocyanea]GGG65132.1 carboxylic ester hydrolase [Sinomonas atrocyanea]
MNREPVAHTQQGSVQGVALGDTLCWRGLRYAAPPTGARRWLPPQEPAGWSGVRRADRFGFRAPQVITPELVPTGGAAISDSTSPSDEDCLFLNVCAPSEAPGAALPVLVWFHGGGYSWGSGAHYIGDGQALAEAGVVVVTVNYRLGALGFLRLGHLLGPEYEASANCGLLDQIAALRWVHENIGAFGGDPDRVTIAGVSAGGKSVATLMAAPAARGLFQQAIIQSGGDHVVSMDRAEELTDALLHALSLDRADARSLLGRPTEAIGAAQQELAAGARATWLWRPAVDGLCLPEAPTAALASGHAQGIRLMAGVTRNEAGSYALADPTAADQAPRVLREIFGGDAETVMEAYAASRPGASEHELQLAILGDERYGIPTIRLLDAQASHAPCWRYRFDAPTPGAPPEKWGFHGADVSFVWGIGLDGADEQSLGLSEAMREVWVSFINGGIPDSADLPAWPEYEPAQRRTMVFDLPSRVEADPAKAERQAWDHASWEPGTWWPIVPAMSA